MPINESVNKFKEYLERQKENHKKWIKEAIDEDKDTTALNSKLKYIKATIDAFNYTFKEYLENNDDEESTETDPTEDKLNENIDDEELPWGDE